MQETSREAFLAGAVYLAGGLSFSAMAQGTPPNFAHSPNGWYAYNRLFIHRRAVPDPCCRTPRVRTFSNDEFRVTGRQPTERVADLNNPFSNPGRGRSCASATSLCSPESKLSRRARVAGRKALPHSCSRP